MSKIAINARWWRGAAGHDAATFDIKISLFFGTTNCDCTERRYYDFLEHRRRLYSSVFGTRHSMQAQRCSRAKRLVFRKENVV